ncbi:MAG: ABC transporter ATP-binding protein [Brevundimonas sp.]|uniref:ABC transporter ATP-binding protein n=1 Tax=Brevundimonas sp. TaxID=1871086 RepID=UPI0025C31ABA|nr:ABC transporter ATP-binding protein [Brevundimonas sp.]MBX3476065.1 ABC transporter ATP-binding protein [Brevundimonas sp.]
MRVLDVQDLGVVIDGRPILESVSLSLDAGEVLGLVGESGSGKSMTSLAILGLLPPRAEATGQVTLDGASILGASDAALRQVRGRKVGMVFQEPMTALNPLMTIGDQVAETLRIHGQGSRKAARTAARGLLDRVGLPAERFPLGRFPHELSGGQRQRVAIAMAIALKPRVLIADEATTALDVTTQAQILDLLKRLVREDGVGLILITHDLAVVAETADRVAVMKDGEVVEEGPAARIAGGMTHPYSRRLFDAATHAPTRVRATRPEAPPILQIEGVVREYAGPARLFGPRKNVRAVDDVSFVVQPGECVGLVGESGCGKSTLLRTVMALERPQAGRVLVHGEDITRATGADLRRLRRHIQMVFQDPYGSFDPRWRVHRLVAENLHLLDEAPTAAEARRRVDEMLEQVGLSASDGEKFAHEFSGGQRQRIAIARALITGPSILALDEAVSALDVSIRAQILDLLAELSGRLSLSYLFVTHDLTVVRSVADRLMVMRGGRIVETGETEAIFSAPKAAYTRDLLAATPDLSRNMRALAEGRDADPNTEEIDR